MMIYLALGLAVLLAFWSAFMMPRLEQKWHEDRIERWKEFQDRQR